MANEFNIKNGFISRGNGIINGDLTVTSLSATTYYNIPPSGISGSGSTGQIAFFGSSSSLSGDTNLTYNSGILEVSGKTKTTSLQVTSGATNGYVLTSDAFGNATWQATAGGLTNFTEVANSSAPNATVPVNSLTATGATTNIDVAIVPKGTGAFTLDIPDNTSAGGNKRGANAVDLQISRINEFKVASGLRSIVLAGNSNTSSGTNAISGGDGSTATGDNSIALGNSNSATANASIAMGWSNTASFQITTALGYLNTASGNGSFAAGSTNTTSGAGGVGIGWNNIASSSNSTAIGQSNTASGSNSSALGYGNSNAGGQGCTAIGWSNTITAGASYGAFAVGQQNTVSGQGFAVGVQNNIVNGWALGQTNTVAGGVAIGLSNTANGLNSIAIGRQSSSFSIKSRITYGAGQMSTLGDSQISKFILQSRTTGATTTTLIINYGDSITPFSTNQVVLQNNNAFGFTGVIVAKQSGSTNAAMWRFNGLIVRGANAASTTLVMSEIIAVSNIPGWGGPSFAADTTYGALQVQVVGAALTNLQWTANIETTEVIYA
jgi:hypothetical protein